MKGITHFISGVAIASFCPWAIDAAQNGNPTYFVLGAIFGILPDTIDFKFYRYFYRHDVYIEPTSGQLNPQSIADAVAAAISEAARTGRSVRIKLSSIQISADHWRQYNVRIDPDTRKTHVQFGPIVNTSHIPLPDSLPDPCPVAIANFSALIRWSDNLAYQIDIFDGPSFMFTRNKIGEVEIDFLSWHRNGSHSLTVAILLAGIASFWTWKVGIVIFGAYVIHILEDQIGHMGSNLLVPFTKKRTPGLKWMHSGDAIPNFTVVWLCCLLIFWNLYIAMQNPTYHFGFIQFMIVSFVIPFTVFGVLHSWLIRESEK